MEDLADKLIKITQQSVEDENQGGQVYVDDLGIPAVVDDKNNPVELKGNIDYYVCRIIVLNNKRASENRQGRLHKRGDFIYIGSDIVGRTDANLFRLCAPQWTIPPYAKPQIWDRLFELLPELSYDKIVITPKTAFNKKTGDLEWSDEPYQTTGEGGFNG